MPFPVAAAIAAGASLGGTGLSAMAQGSANRKTREWNERMYDKQKQDNLDFWNLQNSYNTPQQQMQRYQEAGLNPALMYGNGTPGNASSAPDAPTAMPLNHKAPDLNIGQAFDTYFNVQTQAQRLSNEKQIGNNLAIDALIKTQDQQAKTMENEYMKNNGYRFRENREHRSNLLQYEDFLDKNARNMMNFGREGMDGNKLEKGSVYSLQAMTQKIMNDLRSTAIEGNRQDNRSKKIRADTESRFRSGNLKDIGAKDWLNMGIQLLR